MRPLALLYLGHIVLSPAILPAQAPRIKVAVTISDSSTGGLFQSVFSGAFRRLGDVDVVLLSDSPDYALEGVVLCDGPCQNTSSYAISIRFSEPLSESSVWAMARIAALPTAFSDKPIIDTIGHNLWPVLAGYQKTHATWVATWGRSRYEEAALELVREIDSRCLDSKRAMTQFLRDQKSPGAAESYKRFLESRQWLC